MRLSRQQARTLKFLRIYIAEFECAPNYDEIAAHLGIKTRSNVFALIEALERKGAIARVPRRARSISILPAGAQQTVDVVTAAALLLETIKSEDEASDTARVSCFALGVLDIAVAEARE